MGHACGSVTTARGLTPRVGAGGGDWCGSGAVGRALLAAGLASLSGLGVASGQTSDVQFQVNSLPPTPLSIYEQPTLGLVRGGSIPPNSTDAMAFSWRSAPLSAIAIPICLRQCGLFLITDAYGGGAFFSSRLMLRRFTNFGAPVDAGDPIVAASVPNRDGALERPALAIRPINGGVGRNNPYVLAWWNQWSWQVGGPCGQTSCDNPPTAFWSLFWLNYLDPVNAPSRGSADFFQPARCVAERPSAAFAPAVDLVVWKDVAPACKQILGGFNGQYLPTQTLVIYSPPSGHVIDRPVVQADRTNPQNVFIVAWREDDLESFSSAVFARRVTFPNILGPVTTVADFGQAAPGTAPAVSVFDDGAFVVQYNGFRNGDPPLTPLLMQQYNIPVAPISVDPPVMSGPPIEVEPSLPVEYRHNIDAIGASASPPTLGRLASVYEVPRTDGGVFNIFGRRVDLLTAELGARTLIPLDEPIGTGNTLAEPHERTALWRQTDERMAVAWLRGSDGNVVCTLRTLPLPVVVPQCLADIDHDGVVDGNDFVLFINSFAIGDVNIDPAADVAGGNNGTIPDPDGTIDGTDFVAFINAFALGC